MTNNPEGPLAGKTEPVCAVCRGTGACRRCEGARYNEVAGEFRVACSACNGTGRCDACDGGSTPSAP